MSNFTIKSTQLRHSIANGYATFEFTPTGYWTDVIDVKLNKGWGLESEFEVDISVGSGGRDKTDNPLQVSKNFHEAYGAALALAERLEANKEFYAKYVAFKKRKDQERRDAEEAKKQALIDADPAIGTKMARVMVEGMKTSIKDQIERERFANPVAMTFKKRGSDDTFTISLEQPGYTSTTRFYIKYNDKAWMEKSATSRKAVIDKIARASLGGFVASK